jgi:hypothetical protein
MFREIFQDRRDVYICNTNKDFLVLGFPRFNVSGIHVQGPDLTSFRLKLSLPPISVEFVEIESTLHFFASN